MTEAHLTWELGKRKRPRILLSLCNSDLIKEVIKDIKIKAPQISYVIILTLVSPAIWFANWEAKKNCVL